MKELVHISNKGIVRRINLNEDSTLTVRFANGEEDSNAGLFITNMGGVGQTIGKCIEVDDFNEWFEAYTNALEAEQAEMAARAERKYQEEKGAAYKAFNELQAKNTIIPTNIASLRIVMRYLNFQNWGGWNLPKMSISYKANQYDCGGRTVTTVTLAEPIEGVTKFKTPSPMGHLDKYENIFRY